MQGKDHSITVIGAGHAGVILAALLRQRGYLGRITLVSRDRHMPYERPPLSKSLLREDLHQPLYPASFYAEQDITLRLGVSVTGIEVASRELLLSEGESISYDQLVVATGLRNRVLDIEGADLDGVHSLRDLDDALALAESLESATQLLVLGGGWIGSEVASSARMAAIPTTLIVREDRPLARSAGSELAHALTKLHNSRGTDIQVGRRVLRLEGDAARRVTRAHLDDGSTVECDVVVAGIGSVPNVELAERAGLMCADGVVVDHHGRTSHPNIFAIGDVTARPLASRSGLFRVESIPNATEQARQVAAQIMADDAPREEVPWFWSDQFDKKIRIAGTRVGADETIVRPSQGGDGIAVFHVVNRHITGVETIDAGAEFTLGKKLIRDGHAVDTDLLADLDTPLSATLDASNPETLAAEDLADAPSPTFDLVRTSHETQTTSAAVTPVVASGEAPDGWSVTFEQTDGVSATVSVEEGETLLDAALRNNIPNMVAECGGQAACGTCHVLVEARYGPAAGEPGELEADMLEFTDGSEPRSRLACQVRANADLDGVTLTVMPC